MTYRKKLIEVALPLDAINKASAREKSIHRGNPSTLHQWWARRPLAACRAVLFAALIDDPSEHPELFPTQQEQERERKRLFNLIEAMVKWESINDQEIMAKVKAEIRKATDGVPPPVLDPFAGGGSIPLEAQRLGLEAYANDLNPVAVLINKALIEIPSKFADKRPVNPDATKSLMNCDWHGAQGLADDIRYYGKWMHAEAERRIGHLYPKVTLSKEYGGEATAIAWLWTRTVTCPNPACCRQMPLVRSFYLSKNKGKEVWVEPLLDSATTPSAIHFTVKTGNGKPQNGTVNRRGARCIACGTPISFDYIRNEGRAGRMAVQLMAIVVEKQGKRIYISPNEAHIAITTKVKPTWKPEASLPANTRDIRPQLYGLPTYGDLFTPRQLVVLTTFSDLVQEVRAKVLNDASVAGLPVDNVSFNDGGTGANAYADGIATYLAEAVSKLTTFHNVLAYWRSKENKSATGLGRQALPMVWDFAEINPFAGAGGDFLEIITKSVPKVLTQSLPASPSGFARNFNAEDTIDYPFQPVISTDPPYYDNISYADLSDFYYVWLRRSLGTIYPNLFSTLLTPKAQELVAMPYRFNGDKAQAQNFFEQGLLRAFNRMREAQHPDYPLTVYYAFKQSETEEDIDEEDDLEGDIPIAVASTGWESMLEGLIQTSFTITGTWPMRTEMSSRLVGKGTNVLASSIVLVCRPRPIDAPIASRRQFLNALRAELPLALKNLQHGSIAPVDLAQASIGPGMAIYSRYSKVVESDGTPMRIRTALQLINRALDEALAEQEGEYDGETRWAVAWFEQYAMNAGEYGIAETLSKAKNTSVQRLVDAGFLEARAGKVRLLKREELADNWNPKTTRLTVWEVMQRMIFALLNGKGEVGAGDILRQTSNQGEVARDLAYRLYTVCERKGWAQEALAYNSLVTSWSEISRLAHREAADAGLWEATYLG